MRFITYLVSQRPGALEGDAFAAGAAPQPADEIIAKRSPANKTRILTFSSEAERRRPGPRWLAGADLAGAWLLRPRWLAPAVLAVLAESAWLWGPVHRP